MGAEGAGVVSLGLAPRLAEVLLGAGRPAEDEAGGIAPDDVADPLPEAADDAPPAPVVHAASSKDPATAAVRWRTRST